MSTFVNYAEPTEIADGLHVSAGSFTDSDIAAERVAVYVDDRAVFLTAEETAELIAALAHQLAAVSIDSNETAGGEA